MLEFARFTSSEIPSVDKRLPVIIPVGLVEAHGPHLPLSVDIDTAGYFSRRIAENTGAILAPQIYYGFADEMRDYPGTVGVSFATLVTVVTEISIGFCRSGFTRQIFLSGHGANKSPIEAAFFNVWSMFPGFRGVCWNYWTEASMTHIHHADKGETEIAMSIGTPTYMERAVDFKVAKPWYKIRSRHALNPNSGGINGEPTKAALADGVAARDQIVRILSDRVAKIIESERSEG